MRCMQTSQDWITELGEQVRRARLERGWTQQRTAARANIGVSALRNLETGRGAGVGTLVKVVRALGLEAWLGTLCPVRPPSPMEQLRARKAATARRRAPRDAHAGDGRA